MTGAEIDLSRRRRLTRLRAELGVSYVPPDVGYELHRVAPLVSEQVAARLDLPHADLELSAEGRRQLLALVARALEEFALTVENRPTPPPSIEALLFEIVQVEGSERCLQALDAILATAREVLGAQLPQLPRVRPHAPRLDIALERYAHHLRRKIAQTSVPRPSPPRESLGPGEVGLSAQVEAQWGTGPVEVYVSVATPGSICTAPQRDYPDTICLIVEDHVVTVSRHPAPPPQSVRSPQAPVVLTAGPVPVGQVAPLHDTLLLLLRLVRAGVASPPVPAVVPVPDLGFLRPSSDATTVRTIAELLRPLTGLGLRRRIVLARTLRLRLRSATVSVLAEQLGMHSQTVRNHLSALHDLFNRELDFSGDTIAVQAALELVLPLWELESAARRRAKRRGRKRLEPPRQAPDLP